MKTTYLYLSALLISFSCMAQDEAAMQKAWEAYMTPGEMHKKLAADTGTWNEAMTMWMAPGAPPEKSTAVAENKMIFNGLYQESIHKGTVMGMPFEGKNTVAFDNAAQEFISTWIDNMGSGIMVMRGKYDAATKTVKLSGDCVDPMTKKRKKMRETWTVIDDNTQKLEMYDTTPDGKEYKSMEIIMTRKK